MDLCQLIAMCLAIFLTVSTGDLVKRTLILINAYKICVYITTVLTINPLTTTSQNAKVIKHHPAEDINMQRRRKPPNICIQACNSYLSKDQKSNNKIKIEKHPVSKGKWKIYKNPNPKRNRVLLILLCRLIC